MNLKNAVCQIISLLALQVIVTSKTFAATSERDFAYDAPSIVRNSSENLLAGQTLIFDYENGNSFKVEYSEFSLIWTAIKGPEVGRSEKDKYLWSEVAPKTYLVSWTEDDGTFVSTVINLQTLSVYSTGTFDGKSWLWRGKVSDANRI